MNKPCYNDSLCLHEYSTMIGLKGKRHLFGAEKLIWFLLLSGIDISGVSKEGFYACTRAGGGRYRRDIPFTFRLVWNHLWGVASTLLERGIYIALSEFDSVIPLLSKHLLYFPFKSKKSNLWITLLMARFWNYLIEKKFLWKSHLTPLVPISLSCKNQSIDLHSNWSAEL